ncbi:MAG: carbohydrate ABC transporter permease [Lachnospiraceae bacterium]|nr:carbohydrate ABC transporter permease [Lachnospiraceae bacterium]
MYKYISKTTRTLFNVVLILVFFIPFYWMAITSIKTLGETLAFPPKFWVTNPQWENFQTALESIKFWDALKNSIIVTLGILVLQVVTIVPAAYAFARYEFIGKKLSFGIVLATMMIPAQLVFLPIFLLLSKLELVNTYWSLILPQATSAFGIFMLRQNFMQVPEELIEAARLDKASEFKIIYRIMLPIARPTVVTLAMLTFIGSWNDYFWPMVLTTTDAVRTLPVAVTSLSMVDGGVAHNIVMAGNMFLIVPIIVVYMFAQKHIIKGFTYMGVK